MLIYLSMGKYVHCIDQSSAYGGHKKRKKTKKNIRRKK